MFSIFIKNVYEINLKKKVENPIDELELKEIRYNKHIKTIKRKIAKRYIYFDNN